MAARYAVLDRHVFMHFRAIYNSDKRTYILLNLLTFLIIMFFSDIIKIDNFSHNPHLFDHPKFVCIAYFLGKHLSICIPARRKIRACS